MRERRSNSEDFTKKYGYKKYKIGKFEEYSLYATNRDFIIGDKVLTFTDLDGRLLAMT